MKTIYETSDLLIQVNSVGEVFIQSKGDKESQVRITPEGKKSFFISSEEGMILPGYKNNSVQVYGGGRDFYKMLLQKEDEGENIFIGKLVRQIIANPEFQNLNLIGRESRVIETFEDENGKGHAKTEDDIWCPIEWLEIVEEG